MSVIQLLNNKFGNDVHFVWALSKDFGSSGFRVGILYSQNEGLIQAIRNLNIFQCVPHPMQLITMDLLRDTAFVTEYLELSCQEIRQSYEMCTSALQQLGQLGLPYVKAEAGIFVYVDFSSLLPQSPTFDHEAKFATLMVKVARVVMTPGSSQRDCRPGWFRICYAWISPEVLEIAMGRIEYMVNQLKTVGLFWYSDSGVLSENAFADVLLLKGPSSSGK